MKITLLRSAQFLLSLALMLPLLGLPFARIGWYNQIEALTAALWLLGGLAAVWNFALVRIRPYLAKKIWAMPVVWGWLPLIALSILASLFQAAPLLSYTGSPQLADGIATFLSLLFLSPIFILLTRMPKHKMLIISLAVIVSGTVAVLSVLGSHITPFPSLKYWAWAPVFFPDYLAYFAIALGVIYAHFRPALKFKGASDVILISIIAAISYYADNKALLAGYGLALFTYAAIKVPLFNRFTAAQKLAAFLFTGLMTLTLFIAFYGQLSPLLPDPLQGITTIESRTQLIEAIIAPFLHEGVWKHDLTALLIGHGWGEYNNTIVSNMTLSPHFSLYNGETFIPSWEFVNRDLVNSHNIFIEHFLAIGLIGLGLFCYVQYKIMTQLRSGHLGVGTFYSVTLGILLIFWFQLPHTLIMTTLAYCILFSKTPPQSKALNYKKSLLVVCVLSSVVLTTLALVQSVSAYMYTYKVALKKGDDLFANIEKTFNTPWFAYDRLASGIRTRQLARSLANQVFFYLKNDAHPLNAEGTQKIVNIAHYLQTRVPQGSNRTALLLSMNLFAELSTTPETKEHLYSNPQAFDVWHRAAALVAQHLPFRSDIFIPYLSMVLERHSFDPVLHYCHYFIQQNPSDAIAHWFLGTVYLQDDSTYEKGLCYLNYALDQNVLRFMPLPPEQVKQIKTAVQGLQCYKLM
jgi:hypothetical protein